MRRYLYFMVFLAVVVAAIMFFTLTFTAQAAQYGTNFKFSNLTQMKDDGWTLTREAGISLPSGGGVILAGSGGVSSSIGHYNDIPLGIFDWEVEVQGIWLGGSGHSWIDAQVLTEKHTYIWAVDGSNGEFVFYRDGVKVPATVMELFGTPSYQERANEQVQLDMERHGTLISFYFNSQLKRTYTEPDTSLSRVIGVSITSPSYSAVKYVYAGAYVPEPSGGGPVDPNPVPETNPPIIVTEPNPQIPTDPISSPPLPAYSLPPSGDPADPATPDYPTGPVTTQTPPNQVPSQEIAIMVNSGVFSVNNEPPKINDGAQAVAEVSILPNYNSAWISSPQNIAACSQEQTLYNAGLIAPETHPGNFVPFGGLQVDYYVTVNTHVSGDLYNPNTVGAAVAIVNAQVTDAQGNVVYQQTITATASQGYSLNDLHEQAAAGLNTYFETLINRNK